MQSHYHPENNFPVSCQTLINALFFTGGFGQNRYYAGVSPDIFSSFSPDGFANWILLCLQCHHGLISLLLWVEKCKTFGCSHSGQHQLGISLYM